MSPFGVKDSGVERLWVTPRIVPGLCDERMTDLFKTEVSF